ncbi:MAG: O-antigen ligase family protein, partial [Candidatus Saccharimonadales bacterium]
MTTTKLTRFLTFGTAAIFVLVPFQALLTTWAGANFGHIDLFRIWKELILALLTIGALIVVYKDKNLKQWLLNSPLTLMILLFVLLQLGLGIFALQTAKVNASALIYGLMINLRFLIFLIICLVLAAKSAWLRQHWKVYVLAPAMVVIAFALAQHFILPKDFLTHFGYGPKTIPAYQAVDQKPQYIRVQSTLRGPNPLGAYLVVILTLLAGFWLAGKQRLAVAAAGLATLIALYFTYSRSAWIAVFVSCLALAGWLVKTKQLRRRLTIGALAIVIILTGLVMVWRHNSLLQNTLFHTSQTSQSLESSNAVRTEAMLDGAKTIIKQPLGGGPGTAGPASFRNSQPARIAENYFIQVGQEVGLIGLGLFV